jgi:hypothetical protein
MGSNGSGTHGWSWIGFFWERRRLAGLNKEQLRHWFLKRCRETPDAIYFFLFSALEGREDNTQG